MALYDFGFIYRTSDFSPPKTDISVTTNTISGSATPLHMQVEDDDGVWEDTVNATDGSGQTRDASQQWLSQPFDGHPVHSLVQLRVTFSVTVTWPDGSVHTGEANQLRLTDATTGATTDYIIFQFKVPPGSTVDFTATASLGNTAYADFPCYGAGTLIDTPDARGGSSVCARGIWC